MAPHVPDVVHPAPPVAMLSSSLGCIWFYSESCVQKCLDRLGHDCVPVAFAPDSACASLERGFANIHRVTGIRTAKAGKANSLLKAIGLENMARRFSKLTTRRKSAAHPDAPFEDELHDALTRLDPEFLRSRVKAFSEGIVTAEWLASQSEDDRLSALHGPSMVVSSSGETFADDHTYIAAAPSCFGDESTVSPSDSASVVGVPDTDTCFDNFQPAIVSLANASREISSCEMPSVPEDVPVSGAECQSDPWPPCGVVDDPAEASLDANASPEVRALQLRALVRRIYEVHNPPKLSELDGLFNKYLGDERTLYLKVCKKYAVDPEPAFGPGPLPAVAGERLLRTPIHPDSSWVNRTKRERVEDLMAEGLAKARARAGL